MRACAAPSVRTTISCWPSPRTKDPPGRLPRRPPEHSRRGQPLPVGRARPAALPGQGAGTREDPGSPGALAGSSTPRRAPRREGRLLASGPGSGSRVAAGELPASVEGRAGAGRQEPCPGDGSSSCLDPRARGPRLCGPSLGRQSDRGTDGPGACRAGRVAQAREVTEWRPATGRRRGGGRGCLCARALAGCPRRRGRRAWCRGVRRARRRCRRPVP